MVQLKSLDEFEKAMGNAAGKIVVVMYHNGDVFQESAFDKMKSEFKNLILYKVNTNNAEDIKNKYSDNLAKPSFTVYMDGKVID